MLSSTTHAQTRPELWLPAPVRRCRISALDDAREMFYLLSIRKTLYQFLSDTQAPRPWACVSREFRLG